VRPAALLLACYLLGSIPIGLIVGRMVRGIDIRQYGSGNIGASNVLRMLGRGPAAVVFIGDTLKGLAPVLVCRALFHNPLLTVTAGLLSLVGHNCSIFLKFRGGKGVATSLGVVIGIHPIIAAIAFSIWVILLATWRYISIASIFAAASVSLMMWLSGVWLNKPVPMEYRAFAVAAGLFILVKHRSNIARLRAGSEPKIGQTVKMEDTQRDQQDSLGRSIPELADSKDRGGPA
jgi:acyl phosphate:glycerol-3-phosphate acyltransferase